MRLSETIEVDRVFGHVELEVTISDDEVVTKFKVVHDPRFIELAMEGRHYLEVPYIASRICGACSIAHYLASIKAIENALGIEVPEEINSLRDVLNNLQIIQNHILQLTFLALPDYLGVKDFTSLLVKARSIVKLTMKLNSLILKAIKALGGRIVNPNVPYVGGFIKELSRDDIDIVRKYVIESRFVFNDLINGLKTIKLPSLSDVANNYLVLKLRDHYLSSGDLIVASDGFSFKPLDYMNYIEEVSSEGSNSKLVLYKGNPVHVGPRARLLAYRESIKEVISAVGNIDLSNPFSNLLAKLVEIKYLLETIPDILDNLRLQSTYEIEKPKVLSGEGVGVIEAPRGLLIHHYAIEGGRVKYSNIITPTEINSRHIEVSARELATKLLESKPVNTEELKEVLSLLVRTYDPCLPCAVHVIKVGKT